jgi:cyanuric acid amidohydrolase
VVGAGAELADCHVLVLGISTAARNPLRGVHAAMRDAIDAETVGRLLDHVRAEGGTGRPDPRHAAHHAHRLRPAVHPARPRHRRRAARGLVQDTAIYVSGGAAGQGAPGGGSLTVLYRLPPP